jgi:hypothetical protein
MLHNIKNKITRQTRIVKLFLLILTFNNLVNAQFNTEIGYTASFLKAKEVNSIFRIYNNNQNSMIDTMKNLNFINGFNAGIIYRAGIMRFAASWESLTATRHSVEGSIIGQDPISEKKLYFYFNTISGSLSLIKNHFGIGTGIDYNFFRLKTTKSGINSKVDLIKPEKQFLSNKTFMIINFKVNSKLAIELKPYIRVPLKKIDLDPLEEYLNTEKNENFRYANFIQYGLSFNILNGKQPN